MPREYQLKRSPLDQNRLQKIAKDLISEAKDDRELALETYRLFRQMVEENPQDSAAKNLMADCLKIAQSSKNNVIKVMTLIIKMEDMGSDKTKTSGKSNDSVFSELDELTNRFP
jgi:hypothetical protein